MSDTKTNQLHRIAVDPCQAVKTIIAADKAWAAKLLQAIKEQVSGTNTASVNKPFGSAKETGDDGQYRSVFLATSREDGSILTSYSEAVRRNPDAKPDQKMKDRVFFNLRPQKAQGAAAGVDAAAIAEVAALVDAAMDTGTVEAEIAAEGVAELESML